MIKKLFLIIVCGLIFIPFSYAECDHNMAIVSDESGNHYRECQICDYIEDIGIHNKKDEWYFDDIGKMHYKKCTVDGCKYAFNAGEHVGGTHENDGECAICKANYQTHTLNSKTIQYDKVNHWYKCSYKDCPYITEKKEHIETEDVDGDLTHHWYKCVCFDCPFRFEEEKHYGGTSNNGYCSFKLCNKLYMAKVQIDEYEYRKYEVGDKDKLTAKIIPEGIKVPKAEFKWMSSMPDVVSVDEGGNIECLRVGVSIIYAVYGEYVGRCVICVGDLDFSLTPSSQKIYVGERAKYDINVTWENAKKKKININEYVDFNAFWWRISSAKASLVKLEDNHAYFLGNNVTKEPIYIVMWLDNKARIEYESSEEKDRKDYKKGIVELSIIEKDSTGDIGDGSTGGGSTGGGSTGDGSTGGGSTGGGSTGGGSTGGGSIGGGSTGGGSTGGGETGQDDESVGMPGKNTVNRRHVCSPDGYIPNPENLEEQHLKRCYFPECEYYKKGIKGTENSHEYKYNEEIEKNMCVRCYYIQGSGETQPEITYKRDLGIDILKSQYILVRGEETEINVDFTGIDSSTTIYAGEEGSSNGFDGSNDNNAILLTWNIVGNNAQDGYENYAKEVLKISFDKEESVIKVELGKDNARPIRTDMEIKIRNKFNEERCETVELISESPARSQFICKFSPKTPIAIKVGETKDIWVIYRKQLGYPSVDYKEVRDYYESADIPEYELSDTAECTGTSEISVTPTLQLRDEEFLWGQVTGVSKTEEGSPAIITVTATAEYEDGDIKETVTRVIRQGIIVYELETKTSSDGSSSGGSGSSLGGSLGSGSGGSSGGKFNAVAGTMGLLAIVFVVIMSNKATKG